MEAIEVNELRYEVHRRLGRLYIYDNENKDYLEESYCCSDKVYVELKCEKLNNQETKTLNCKKCHGVGEITVFRGQTPESYEELNVPCPECCN
jgi:hypothetical protein